ncbi:MAG: epoxyqueuosine reductase QueH [Bacilli bacterium]
MEKCDYYQLSIDELEKIEKSGVKPSLLLHACCGVCPIFPLSWLYKYFDITVYFNNSNIFPYEEYGKRLEELIIYISEFNSLNKTNIKLINTDYDNDTFIQDLLPFADLPEGEKRCFICYYKRMKDANNYAELKHFDYFTTVMSVSRQKSSEVLNEIGRELVKENKHTKYFYSDFKKKSGGEIGTKIAKDKKMYIQEYCGCQFSLKNSLDKQN